MNFFDSIKSGFRNYATFSGRASRSEYWWFWLFGLIASSIASSMSDSISTIFFLAVFLPSLSMGVRRLHDTGRSGWWIAVPYISLAVAFVAGIVILVDIGIDFSGSVSTNSIDSFDGVSAPVLLIAGLALLTSFVGFLVNLGFLIQKSDPNLNRFGPPPPPKV